jgi:hypothetical protein
VNRSSNRKRGDTVPVQGFAESPFCSGLATFGALDTIQTLSAPAHFLRKRNAHVD